MNFTENSYESLKDGLKKKMNDLSNPNSQYNVEVQCPNYKQWYDNTVRYLCKSLKNSRDVIDDPSTLNTHV